MSNSILEIKALGFPWETQDPFLFCAHHADDYPAGNGDMGPNTSLAGRAIGNDFQLKDGWRMYHGSSVPGFPVHPHRGFETVSIVENGLVDHSDSLGAAGRFGNGDVQWMTAGKGVQHSEMFPLLNERENNPLEMFQIWLNLPAKDKMVDAHFRMLWHEDIPVVKLTSETKKASSIKIIAGEFEGQKALEPTPNSWAASASNHVRILTIKMEKGAHLNIPKSQEGLSRTLYFYKGQQLEVDGQQISNYHLVKLDPTKDLSLIAREGEANLLFLEGRPIGEPVAQYGPFVMNNAQQIQEAMYDYQRTQYGGWPWPKQEMVHEKSRGRFALHANGVDEIK